MTDLTGLEGLVEIGGLTITDTALGSLSGLDNLTAVEGHVAVAMSDNLTDLTGLEKLATISGSLTILDNSSLGTLGGIGKLTGIGDCLIIRDNALLTSVSALNNVENGPNVGSGACTGSALFIENNEALPPCEVADLVVALGVECECTGNNGTCAWNCSGHADCQGGLVCATDDTCQYPCLGSYVIDDVDTSGDLSAIHGCHGIEGSLTIQGTALENLAGLEGITSVGDYLSVFNNNSLTTIQELDNLTYVGDYLHIASNDALEELAGLENLRSVERCLMVWHNDVLTDIMALQGITDGPHDGGGNPCSGAFNIWTNPFLPSCQTENVATLLGVECTCSGNNDSGICP